jgi:hypothetical protein
MRSPGSSVADLIAMAPHLPLALGLLCWTLTIGLRLRRRLLPGEIISGLAAGLGLQLIYPQLGLLAVVVLIGWSLIRRQQRALRFALLAGAIQAPYLVYLLWLARNQPLALGVIRPSLDVGDPFGFLVLSHLTASGLIIVALWRGRLRGDLLLPALWIVVMTAFMFLPGIDRLLGRSFMASSIPFGLCATPGLVSLLRSIRGRAQRRRLALAILAASSLYGLISLAQPLAIAAMRLDPQAEYEQRGEALLLQRLAPHLSSGDVILTTYLDGIFVPAQTPAKAFVGHPEMTLNAPRKADQAYAFFRRWDASQRDRFLQATGIHYVLTTDRETGLRLQTDPMLRQIDTQDGAVVFRVDR